MQRGGRKRAVLEPDEHPASRTSVDTGHDPHLRHAGTAAKAEHSPHAIRSALTMEAAPAVASTRTDGTLLNPMPASGPARPEVERHPGVELTPRASI